MKRYDKDGNEVEKPLLYDNWIDGISPIWDEDLPIYKAYKYASTPQQMAERIKELTIMNTNLIELNDKKDVEVRESQQENQRLREEINKAMLKDYSSRTDLVNDINEILQTKQNKEG